MDSTIVPPPLKQGDCIGLAATARFIEQGPLDYATSWFESKGFKVKHASNLRTQTYQLAGGDEVRIQAFNELVHDPDVRAIVVVRGGYGTVRIVDGMDWEALKERPIWLCGFSDVTVIHNYASRQMNMASIHCAMPVTYENNTSAALESLYSVLTSANSVQKYPARIVRKGQVEGQIVGGNLSVIYSQLGSTSQLDTTGKVLFIEDLDEFLYHTDRMMWAIKRAGLLDGIQGLIVGGFTAMKDNTVAHGQSYDNPWGASAERIIMDSIKGLDIPIAFDVPIGHLADNRALVINRNSRVDFLDDAVHVRHI